MYVEVKKTVDVPIDGLWALLGDFANEGAATGLVVEKGEGFGLGATCTSGVEGHRIWEMCVNHDPEKFIVSYIIDMGETPIYDYIGTARLHFVDVNHTMIHWYSHWRWRDLLGNENSIEDWERLMKNAYITVIDNMVKKVKGGH